ncbi:EF-hand domain-containing protein [Saccharothrix sp.]|uniref:EF-hand domain-containing protein n=1 Tax=Saccharothrix sp. TaxID=1873460 RepID=UPI002811D26B|nr:EF-hand domain-containing protein [Saccharothrix sp.]
MSEQVRLDNIFRVFTAFDTDDDSRISWRDFEVKARGIGLEFRLAGASPEVTALTEAYREIWDYIRGADVDVDGEVTQEEFREAHEAGRLTTGELLTKWETAAARAFAIADRDGDGRLDEQEFTRLYRGAGITDPQVAAIAFASVDVDSDGLLELSEFITQTRGLFTATDESAKGTHLLGE